MIIRTIVAAVAYVMIACVCFSAEPIAMNLIARNGGVYLTIRNDSDHEYVFSPFKKRWNSPLVVVLFQDGSLVPDSFWKRIPKCIYLRIPPHAEIGALDLGFVTVPGRFKLEEAGRYYVKCFLKKSDAVTDDLWASNCLAVTVEKGKIVSWEGSLSENFPGIVRKALEKELADVLQEEKQASISDEKIHN